MRVIKTKFEADVRCPWCNAPHEIINFPIDERTGAYGTSNFNCVECDKKIHVGATWRIHYVVGKE